MDLTTCGHLDGFNQDDFGAHGGFTHVPHLKPFSRLKMFDLENIG
jgi:hypothetical protein